MNCEYPGHPGYRETQKIEACLGDLRIQDTIVEQLVKMHVHKLIWTYESWKTSRSLVNGDHPSRSSIWTMDQRSTRKRTIGGEITKRDYKLVRLTR